MLMQIEIARNCRRTQAAIASVLVASSGFTGRPDGGRIRLFSDVYSERVSCEIKGDMAVKRTGTLTLLAG
jgi:hypothetical protein